VDPVQYFLIVFDRRQRELLRVTAFDDSQAAMLARFEEEHERGAGGDVEVVVLGASNVEALKGTHSRYFETVEALAKA
jgi:hypothetical protein